MKNLNCVTITNSVGVYALWFMFTFSSQLENPPGNILGRSPASSDGGNLEETIMDCMQGLSSQPSSTPYSSRASNNVSCQFSLFAIRHAIWLHCYCNGAIWLFPLGLTSKKKISRIEWNSSF